jgi:hypothetical protein
MAQTVEARHRSLLLIAHFSAIARDARRRFLSPVVFDACADDFHC